jgi:putative transposase
MGMKTFKYRLYPTRKQAETLQWTLDRVRELYNAALQERREMYKYTGKGTTYNAQANQLPEIKEIREEYKNIHSQVLQDTLKRVDKAFQAFFRRVKAGENSGYPRFQGKARYDSFTYPQAGFSIEGNKLMLSKIGHVKIKLHRPMQGKIKTCTVKREGCHWYLCLACEVEACPRPPYTDEAIGIDLGVSKLATLSTGDVIENPRHYRHAEKRLKKAQQALSRKKRGSNRRKKAVKVVSRIHRKTRNQRNDYLHKWSRWLVDCYETMVFEDTAPANLSKRPKPKQDENGKYLPNNASAKSGLNKSILDAGWYQFIAYCEYKAESAGSQVVRVNPRYTSQVCSQCGTVRKKELSERWHSCECGCEMDRDHNAAVNIKNLWVGSTLQQASAS